MTTPAVPERPVGAVLIAPKEPAKKLFARILDGRGGAYTIEIKLNKETDPTSVQLRLMEEWKCQVRLISKDEYENGSSGQNTS